MSWNEFIEQRLKQRKYLHCKRTKKDIISALNAYKDLGVNECLYQDDTKRKHACALLCLTGTICLSFDNHVGLYLSIRVVVKKQYPDVPPVVYIIPTSVDNSDKNVIVNRYVDNMTGLVSLPLIKRWGKVSGANILSVLDQLRKVMVTEKMECSTNLGKPMRAKYISAFNQPDLTTGARKPCKGSVAKATSIWDSFINQKLNGREYRYRMATKYDVITALATFTDLVPCCNNYVTNDDVILRNLLCLSGTIPVCYEGLLYEVPIEIGLLPDHPCSAPIVSVKTSEDFKREPTSHVGYNGDVTLPMLTTWRRSSEYNLVELIYELIETFECEVPVVLPPRQGDNTCSHCHQTVPPKPADVIVHSSKEQPSPPPKYVTTYHGPHEQESTNFHGSSERQSKHSANFYGHNDRPSTRPPTPHTTNERGTSLLHLYPDLSQMEQWDGTPKHVSTQTPVMTSNKVNVHGTQTGHTLYNTSSLPETYDFHRVGERVLYN